MESRFVSAMKSVIWRFTGIVLLAVVTYCFTRNWIQTGLVTVLHHGVFLIVFYVHERVWLKISVKSMFKKSLFKMLTYETFCGNVILGTITYVVTNDFAKMTYITLTYIGIKHVCYVINEYVWKGCLHP